MSRRFTPKVVTANRLREGDVVYLNAAGEWTPHHHEAALLEDEARAAEFLALAAKQPLYVVGPYLADARPGANGPEPTHFREEFRTRGPSNYAHGKQVDLT
jgi:hypothetical protein